MMHSLSGIGISDRRGARDAYGLNRSLNLRGLPRSTSTNSAEVEEGSGIQGSYQQTLLVGVMNGRTSSRKGTSSIRDQSWHKAHGS